MGRYVRSFSHFPSGHKPGWVIALIGIALFVGEMSAASAAVDLRVPNPLTTTFPTKVMVTLTPSPSPEAVVLRLRAVEGAGSAVFLPGRVAQITVTTSTTLEVLGTEPSENPMNFVVEAMVGSTRVASELVTIIDPRMLTPEQAVARAREILKEEFAAFAQEFPPKVSIRLRSGEYRMTFWFPFGSDERAENYRGRIMLDAVTGAVKRIGGRSEEYN